MCLNSGMQAIHRLTHGSGTYAPRTFQIRTHVCWLHRTQTP